MTNLSILIFFTNVLVVGYAQYGTPVDTADDVPIKMKGRAVDLTEEEKAEQLKDKILESLKLND